MKKPAPPDWSDRITKEYIATVKAMLEQVRAARHDNWGGHPVRPPCYGIGLSKKRFCQKELVMDDLKATHDLSIDDRFYLLLHNQRSHVKRS